MADNNRNQGSYASDENWDKNQRRSTDDRYRQQSYYNSGNMDLDRDGMIGQTGNFYGGTNYMGSSAMGTNYDRNQNWSNPGQNRQNRDYGNYHGSSYGYDNRRDYEQGQNAQYGNATHQYYGNQENYNRNIDYRNRQDYNQQYNDYDDRRQWQDNRPYKGSQSGDQDHPLYYGHVAGFGNEDYNRDYRSDFNRDRSWSDYESNRRQGNRNWNQGYNVNRNQDRSWWDKTRDEVSSWFGDEDAERRRRMDERNQGGYKGKGPKEYHRSDERIREDVCDRLSEDSYVDASDIEVRVLNGEVTLNGTVDQRSAKRRAEDLIESISGVTHVQNNLRVGQSMNVSSSTLRSTSTDTTNRTDEDYKKDR